MSKKSVFCITTSREQADRIVDQLKTANFSNNDISVLFPDKAGTRETMSCMSRARRPV